MDSTIIGPHLAVHLAIIIIIGLEPMIYIACNAELLHQRQHLDASTCMRPGSQTAMTWTYSPNMHPSSPTLTNPDMILPYDGDVSRASTPSPPPQTVRHFTPHSSDTLGWHPSSVDQPAEDSHSFSVVRPTSQAYGQGEKHLDTAKMELGAKDHEEILDGSPAYDDTDTLSRPLLRVESKKGGNPYYVDGFLMPGTLGDHHLDPGYRSSGTVFEIDEDVKSVREDDLLGGHGDNDGENQNQKARSSSIYDRTESPSALLLEEDGDDLSSASLSKQAERILASAKRKLDKMEGNLSRARHSLIMSPTPPPSSSLNTSPHSLTRRRSPSSGNQYLVSQNLAPRTSLDNNRDLQFHSSTRSSTSGHSRIVSETSVPTSVYRRQESDYHEQDRSYVSTTYDKSYHLESGIGHQGSESADETVVGNMISQSARSNLNQHQFGPREHFNPFRIHNRSSPTSFSTALNPVDERDASSAIDSSVEDVSVTDSYTTSNSQAFMPPNLYSKRLTHSRSATPIREVRDQMEDLKGRISNLQQRAKADSLRRRSLQSLRTHSPFTAAEQWYRRADEVKEDGLSDSAGTGRYEGLGLMFKSDEAGVVHANGEESSDHEKDGRTDTETPLNSAEKTSIEDDNHAIPKEIPDENVDEYQSTTENNHISEYVPETNGAVEESQNSEAGTTEDEAEYYEAPVSIGERHEDRADAFDYERFYLYSALGSYTGGDDRRDSYISNDSTGSVETAKPEPGQSKEGEANGRPPQLWIHSTVSTESLVTVGTFATAMEGEGEEDDWEDDGVRFGGRTPVIALPGSYPTTSVDTINRDAWNGDEYFQEQQMSTNGASRKAVASNASSNASWPLSDTNESSKELESISLLLSALHISPASLRLSRQATTVPAALAAEDQAAVKRLLDNLGQVCTRLQQTLNDPNRDEERLVFRTRLAEASRILEGS